jgi:hypothetical protein
MKAPAACDPHSGRRIGNAAAFAFFRAAASRCFPIKKQPAWSLKKPGAGE